MSHSRQARVRSRLSPVARRKRWALAWLATGSLAAGAAVAESQIVLPFPNDADSIVATTFDAEGHPVGHSSFSFERGADGREQMRVEMSVEHGGRNVSEALFATVRGRAAQSAPEAARGGLRLLEERAQAVRADGTRLDRLVIDHVHERVSCHPPDDDALEQGHSRPLPDHDRVVNVPMQLLFEPLVQDEVDDVHFQIVVCRGEPRIHDMIAVRGARMRHHGRPVLEIRYGPDLGKTIAWFASRLLPSFSFWFDEETGAYLAHRMPLYREGPEILLVRSGLAPTDLGLE